MEIADVTLDPRVDRIAEHAPRNTADRLEIAAARAEWLAAFIADLDQPGLQVAARNIADGIRRIAAELPPADIAA